MIIMINEEKYLDIVSNINAEINDFIPLAISQDSFKDILVKHLLKTDSINIYYRSYLILYKATKINPALFYCYWDKFSSLLKYDNSYHRNYGMDLIANLIVVDKDNLFDSTLTDYYKQLNDVKISTIKHCIINSETIIKFKPHLTSIIITKIIDSLRVNDNSERYQNFLISEFLKLLTSINTELSDKNAVRDFLRLALNNTTSAKIKRAIIKYGTQQTV